jgi:hypothetical protein
MLSVGGEDVGGIKEGKKAVGGVAFALEKNNGIDCQPV